MHRVTQRHTSVLPTMIPWHTHVQPGLPHRRTELGKGQKCLDHTCACYCRGGGGGTWWGFAPYICQLAVANKMERGSEWPPFSQNPNVLCCPRCGTVRSAVPLYVRPAHLSQTCACGSERGMVCTTGCLEIRFFQLSKILKIAHQTFFLNFCFTNALFFKAAAEQGPRQQNENGKFFFFS